MFLPFLNFVLFRYDKPASLMLYTKFHCNRPSGDGIESFEGFLSFMSVAAILVISLRFLEQTFVPRPMEDSREIWLQSAQWFQRRCLKMLTDGRTDDGFLAIL